MPCPCEALKLTGNFVATDNGIENLAPTNKVSASDPLQIKWRWLSNTFPSVLKLIQCNDLFFEKKNRLTEEIPTNYHLSICRLAWQFARVLCKGGQGIVVQLQSAKEVKSWACNKLGQPPAAVLEKGLLDWVANWTYSTHYMFDILVTSMIGAGLLDWVAKVFSSRGLQVAQRKWYKIVSFRLSCIPV